MSDNKLLFFEPDLDSQLRTRQMRVGNLVDEISKEQFLISNDNEIIEHIVSQLEVRPLEFQLNARSMQQYETRVDVSGDSRRYFEPSNFGRPCYVPGTKIEVTIPFTGDEWIFHYRTNPYSSVFPRAKVIPGHILISISLPCDVEQESFKNEYERQERLVQQHVEQSGKQVEHYNQSLRGLVIQAISSRRERLKHHADIATLLDIPITAKKDAPQMTPVKVDIRRIPELSVPPKSGLKPEPGICDETYETILRFIRHQGRTFETTPGDFALHNEEGLRNIILAQ